MNVAVLTLTRDRLEYTTHCFDSLFDHSGCDYDHYVLDQASQDGTAAWLTEEAREGNLRDVLLSSENMGLCRGLNYLIELMAQGELGRLTDYDVVVRFDNDCEVLRPGTLRTVCEVARAYEAIVAPRVLGLQSPPRMLQTTQLGEHVLEETAILGGIFMAIPAKLFSEYGFRYDESMPPYTGDEAIVPWWRARGGRAGYLQGWEVIHYLTTEGQRADPRVTEYEQRKLAEMGYV